MFGRLTPLVKNLLIITIALHFLNFFLLGNNISLNQIFGLSFVGSSDFRPYQFITYIFLHQVVSPGGGIYFWHLFGNMLALFIFGPMLENFLGQKKFLILYMVTGIGAGLFYTGVNYVEVMNVKSDVQAYVENPNSQDFNRLLVDHGDGVNPEIYNFVDVYSRNENDSNLKAQSVRFAWQLYDLYGRFNMVGASGAVFGILAAFALFFPNTELFLLFMPFPIKAKYLVGAYILYEVFSELQRAPGDNVAHLAHIGGALIAFILVKVVWKQNRKDFY